MTPVPELHDYQKEAVEYIRVRKRAGLFLDMGLGKTCICLTALTPEMLPALVVAPKRVAELVWPKEGPKWRPDLTVKVAAGSPKKRQEALTSGADIVSIGRDNLADALPHAHRFRTFIMDELSSFKSNKSIRFKVAKKIAHSPGMTHVWGLTGTPTPNGLMDLWPQIYLLDGGERLGKNITGFKNRYYSPGRQLPNGVITEWNLRPGAEGRITNSLVDLCLSMETEGRVKLPPVTYSTVEVPLPPQVRQTYKKLKNTLVADLKDLGLGTEIHSAATAAALSNRLSQITAGFMYVDDADLHDGAFSQLHVEKVRTMREIIDGTGGPVMVAYRYKAEAALIRANLGLPTHGLDTPHLVERWTAGDLPVLLVHPDSVGHGLNLQEGPGHTLIWASVPWSLESYQQTNKRLARQGQQQPVRIHHLVSPHTVDEAIMLRQQEKKSVQDALLDHLSSPM